MPDILICDDDADIVAALKIYLTQPDYRLFTAANGKEALETLEREEIQLILLDIMMPVMDGLSALAAIREKSHAPVILLTAKSEDTDKVLGLNLGADDYITKPFQPLEVCARVRSQLRRYLHYSGAPKAREKLTAGGIELDDRTKEVLLDGEPVSLTHKEYEILKLLMSSPGAVFSPKEIYAAVWKEKPFGSDNTVAVHIRHLREKLEIDPAEPRHIKVVFGQGYKLERGREA
jgi:DNA-binding response OmpR family regulator